MADTRKKTVSGVGYYYSIVGLNKWFALSSIALTATMVWMVLFDHTREWKALQTEFRAIELEKTRAQIVALEQDPDWSARYEAAKQALVEADARFAEIRKDADAALAELRKFDGTWYNADQKYRFARAELDSARYYYDEARNRHPDLLEKAKAEFDRLTTLSETYRVEKDKIEALQGEIQTRFKGLTSEREDAEKALQAARMERDRLERQAGKLSPSLATAVLDAPLMNFMQPTLKVEQVVLASIRNDINFMYVPRVDRCVTCHLAIGAPEGYAEERQPFRSHPRLDTFLAADSPHPYESFGCTSCHLGRDRATEFTRATHTPDSPEQAEAWKKEHDWHPLHHWDFPMLPLRYTEAACRKCHMEEVSVPGAPKLNKGILLFERLGCHGCHKVDGLDDLHHVGPDLVKMAAKLSPEWTYKWVSDPKNFRMHTRMPRFFNLSNTDDPESLRRSEAEIHAITAYLYQNSKVETYPAPPAGNAARGKDLFESAGCLGCHTLGAEDDPSDWMFRSHGPNLSGVGSKVSPGWLFAWLKNPKNYDADSRMPSLRLTDSEAADLTVFLMAQRNEAFDRERVSALDEEALDGIMFGLIESQMLVQEARDKVARTPLEEKKQFVGRRLIAHYGCFGCHDITGFESANRIGTELSDHGRKKIEQFDFAFVKIPKTRHDWFYQKLKDPRVYDGGMEKRPLEKLKMPQFDLTDEEREALVTALLSFSREDVLAPAKRELKGDEIWIERGRRLIRDYNCQGCHQMEGRAVRDEYGNYSLAGSMGGDIGAAAPAMKKDPGMRPPNLIGQGAKTRPEWLFKFFQGPTPIRPWLAARMPTFGFDDAQVNALVRYFASLDRQMFPYESFDYGRVDSVKLQAGRDLFLKLQCQKCHDVSASGSASGTAAASELAPNLLLARERLKPRWIPEWVEDPQGHMPGTKMPQFFFKDQGVTPMPHVLGGDIDAQTEALRDYILQLR
jgi:cbb3-type cytochrome oxidase cytochrome c subunit